MYNRTHLINELAQTFAEDFRAVLEPFSDEHQVEVCDVLTEIAERFEKNENLESINKDLLDPLLVKHKRRMLEFSNRRLTDYMLRGSVKLLDLMRRKGIDGGDHFMTAEEYSQFMYLVKNHISNHRYYTLLRMSPEDELASQEESAENTSEKNKKFTARRRALFLHYLDKHFHISADRKPLAEIAHFLTGNNEDNLYKYLRSPLDINGDEKTGKSTQVLIADLNYVKYLFHRLGSVDIVKTIEKDINSF